MGTLGTNAVTQFGRPTASEDPGMLGNLVRGNDNVLQTAFNAHDDDASLHTVTTTTTGVSSATAIYSAITGMAVAWVQGSDGTNTFVDQVAWNGATNIKGVVSSTTVDGAPAARTYSVAGGVLKVAMAAGTYTITIVPIAFS